MTQPTILFLHQNFPGQFRLLAGYMVKRGWKVYAAGAKEAYKRDRFTKNSDGVSIIGFDSRREPRTDTHKYLKITENAILNGQGFARVGIKMKNSGINPDVIVAHSGWGSGSFAKSIWPDAKFVQYLEWWYTYPGRDRPRPPDDRPLVQHVEARANVTCRNIPFLLDAMQAEAIIAPTAFQAADVPDFLRSKLHVMHDGVDCDFFYPEKNRQDMTFAETLIPADTKLLTYATRGMEPMRGFPEFMEALSYVMEKDKKVQCIIAGNETIHYGNKLHGKDSYKKQALENFSYDMGRLHFVGQLNLNKYAALLRRSDCHVYLTRPFVLSWSCIEAMASGAPIVTTDTAPVREALPLDSQALHVDHTDIHALIRAIHQTLDDPKAARARGTAARAQAEDVYNATKLLPAHAALFDYLRLAA